MAGRKSFSGSKRAKRFTIQREHLRAVKSTWWYASLDEPPAPGLLVSVLSGWNSENNDDDDDDGNEARRHVTAETRMAMAEC